MRKNKFILVFWFFLILPNFCWALDLDILKTDFLQGNYRRVIFEGQAQVDRMHSGNADELNYILGLSYFKESKLDLAQDCFRRVLSNPNSKFKPEASLALADTYLVGGQLQQAEDLYNKLITGDANSSQKPAIWYRLSQLESKRGDQKKSNDYLFKLKRDFPMSSELRLTRGIVFVNTSAVACEPLVNVQAGAGEYSIQVGFFTSSLNANNFKNTLLSKDYPAYVESSGTGYRVKVGRFKSQKEALALESKLSQEGFATKVCPL
ncbi:MAG: SPOR domain-containing protein [Candidatus Omnitrophica bacterium]|nr:SPOR domain-containing protein [Candidatus Omnitrophota bacterium]